MEYPEYPDDQDRFEFEHTRRMWDYMLGSDPDYVDWLEKHVEEDLTYRQENEVDYDEEEESPDGD